MRRKNGPSGREGVVSGSFILLVLLLANTISVLDPFAEETLVRNFLLWKQYFHSKILIAMVVSFVHG